MKSSVPIVQEMPTFKLVPRLLDESSRSKQIKLWFSIHSIILKEKPIGLDKKKSLIENSRFGEPKCKLWFIFFCFFSLFSFTFVTQILWEWKTCYGLSTLLRALQLPHFGPIKKLAWLILRILTRWLLKKKGMHSFFKCTKWR